MRRIENIQPENLKMVASETAVRRLRDKQHQRAGFQFDPVGRSISNWLPVGPNAA
jgi:hypothetical protein